MIYSIEQLKELVAPIARKYNLKAVYVFGSYARGEATEESDIDLMVDLEGADMSGFFTMGGLYSDFCDVLGDRTDMITTFVLSDIDHDSSVRFSRSILRDRVTVYEQ
jgi:predicted nucleotidyltransferase